MDERAAAQPGLEVDDVVLRYGNGGGVGPISFKVDRGTLLGIAGGNGAGKTTLLRVMAGLYKPQQGCVYVDGERVRAGAPPRGLGAMIEEPAFYPFATAVKNLEVTAAGRADWLARIEPCLDLVGLKADGRRISQYSQGMRQRLGLARALIGEPSLLLLDEPANALDPASILWLRGFLREMAGAGVTTIVSSHLLGELGRVADSALVMHDGRIMAEVSPAALAEDFLAIEHAFFASAEAGTRCRT